MPQYPQYIFSSEILKLAGKDKLLTCKTGVDIPCGAGYTTHYLSKGNAVRWLGVDIDKHSIDFAIRKFSSHRIVFQTDDIFLKLRELKNVDILCIINSIFLLPDHDKLFNLVFSCLKADGEAYFIIPNVEGKNYRNFSKKNSGVNVKEYSVEALTEALAIYGLTTQTVKGICHANIYGRKEIKYMSRLAPYYLIVLNYFMTWCKIGTPSYFLVQVKRSA